MRQQRAALSAHYRAIIYAGLICVLTLTLTALFVTVAGSAEARRPKAPAPSPLVVNADESGAGAAPEMLGPASGQLPSYTFTVNWSYDASDVLAGDGICNGDRVVGSKCTLRAALEEANARPGATYTILFDIPKSDPGYYPESNTYIIGLEQRELLISAGVGTINIVGPTTSHLTIYAKQATRILYISADNTVNISNVNMFGGSAPEMMTTAVEMSGGGIFNLGTLNLTDCALNSNYAGTSTTDGVDGGSGGAIYNAAGAQLTLIRGWFHDNRAGYAARTSAHSGSGGAIYNAGTLQVTDSTFKSNSTYESNSSGGGLSAGGGGAIFNAGGSVSIARSTLFSNSTYGLGGGVSNPAGTMLIANSTINNNLAYDYGAKGGGIYNAGTLTVVACTISGNKGGYAERGGAGGGIYAAEGAQTNIRNSIVGDNAIGEGGLGPDIYGTVNSQDFNLIEDTSGATIVGATAHNITGWDPRLKDLSDNGGPTRTQALFYDSPAANTGDDAVMGAPFNLTTDQRGVTRKIGTQVDIGAFESDFLTPAPTPSPRPPNNPPVAVDDTYGPPGRFMPILVSSTKGVLANDTDADGDHLTAQLVIKPTYGSLTLQPDGSFTYYWYPGAAAADTFTYRASDGKTTSNMATVYIEMFQNTPPVAVDDFFTVVKGETLKIGPPGVLWNDYDPDGDHLFAHIYDYPQHGYMSFSQIGGFTYTPNAGFVGTDTFTYKADDETAARSNKATVTITVLAAPTPTPTPTPTPVPTPTPGIVEFEPYSFSVNEAGCVASNITVKRTGNISSVMTVDYTTSDWWSSQAPCQNNTTGFATERCDYVTTSGTLRFAAGEVLKVIPLLIVDDAYVEGPEKFIVRLSNPQGGLLGSIFQASITINDNDSQTATQNPIEETPFFVCLQYADFLGRVPDDAGFQFWTQRMSGSCPPGQFCDPIDTSSRFFSSDEFTERGYFVYLFYQATLGRQPKYYEWVMNVAKLNAFQTAAEQAASKDAFVNNFINQSEFRYLYDQYQTGEDFVEALCQRAGVEPAAEQSLKDNYAIVGRAKTVRAMIETPEVQEAFRDKALVTMLYFGFLRRDPEPGGYDFWMQKLIDTNRDYRFLIGGFLQSDEYHFRFASIPANR